jgi:hypothetical protein
MDFVHCLFSGEETDSLEHVVPQWLQRRFSLQDQTITIPNGTTLKYRHLTVPAAKEHNALFGQIEQRISQGEYRLDEVYLWALKLHIGLVIRDSSLRSDIRDPRSPFILNVGDFHNELTLFRVLYSLWRDGGDTNPLPVGSVYILDSLLPNDQFALFDCLITGTVGIHVGGKFIVVFLWDQGRGLRSNSGWLWETEHSSVKAMEGSPDYDAHCFLAHHVWACESAYWLYLNRRHVSFIKSTEKLSLIPPWNTPQPKEVNEAEYRMVCRSFGLELAFFTQQMVGNGYSLRSSKT